MKAVQFDFACSKSVNSAGSSSSIVGKTAMGGTPSGKLSKALAKRNLDDAGNVGPSQPKVVKCDDSKVAREVSRRHITAAELWDFFLQFGQMG